MTALSPIDVRFACTCSHASGAHPPFPVMRCTECDCDGYRPARTWRWGKLCDWSGHYLGEEAWGQIVCPSCSRFTTVLTSGRVAKHKSHIENHNRGRCYHVDYDGVSRRCKPEPLTAAERFALYVDKTGNCWLWTGACERTGYGAFRFEGRQLKAHRYAWELENGPIPKGMIVCHHCDVRACVRPSHLFLGTTLDNIRDKQAKGRQPYGVDIRSSKLTPPQVLEIRLLFPSTTLSELSRQYGVSVPSIKAAVTGKTWKHV